MDGKFKLEKAVADCENGHFVGFVKFGEINPTLGLKLTILIEY